MAEPKLLDQACTELVERVRNVIRLKHYSYRTEQTYLHWITRYIHFHKTDDGSFRHPRDLGPSDVAAFLTHLATAENVAASTQNVAMQSVLFLYRQVLHIELTGIEALRAQKDKRLPVVLTKPEVNAILAHITDPSFQLQAKPCPELAKDLYGAGLRLLECLRLRVKDIDFGQHLILVRDTKGNEDRTTLLPEPLVAILHDHLRRVKSTHAADLKAGHGAVYLLYALERKYPNAN